MLEKSLRDTTHSYGAGSGFYLNGDEIRDSRDLIDQIRILISLFPPHAGVKRIFIDEITAIENWQKALKRLADTDEIYDVLIVTTGSKATDLRRGTERLPGRKGKLEDTLSFSWILCVWVPQRPGITKEKSRFVENRQSTISLISSPRCPGLHPIRIRYLNSDHLLHSVKARGLSGQLLKNSGEEPRLPAKTSQSVCIIGREADMNLILC